MGMKLVWQMLKLVEPPSLVMNGDDYF